MTFRTTLFDISAAFPSVCWDWVWAVMAALEVPDWVHRAARGLMTNSAATVYINRTVFSQASELRNPARHPPRVPDVGVGVGLAFRPGGHGLRRRFPPYTTHSPPAVRAILLRRSFVLTMVFDAFCRFSWRYSWQRASH